MPRNSDRDVPRLPWFLTYPKGVCTGITDVVSGVSGGTIALITGIYERLISAVTVTAPGRIKRTPDIIVPGRRADAVATMRGIDVGFLLAPGVGTATVIMTVMRVFHITFNGALAPAYGFPFGLVATSVIVLYTQVSLDGSRQIVVAVVGFGLVFVTLGGGGGAFGHLLSVIVVADGIAISVVILPGVSEPFVLLILGQYEYMNAALDTFTDSLLDVAGGAPLSVVVEPGMVVIMLMAEAVVGLFNIVYVARWALERHRRATLAFLVSLIVGALRAPVVESTAALVDAGRSWTTKLYAAFAVAAAVGTVIALFVDRHTDVIESRVRIGTARRSGTFRHLVRRESVSRPSR